MASKLIDNDIELYKTYLVSQNIYIVCMETYFLPILNLLTRSHLTIFAVVRPIVHLGK